MHVSPVLAAQAVYPFVRIEEAKRRKATEGVRIFDFGMGDPREPTDPLIKRALADALDEATGYPTAVGLPEYREAVAAWTERRFGVRLDPATELIPTYGSKEAIFLFAQVVLDAGSRKDVVLVPEPGYPVYERGALFAGAEVQTFPLRAEHGFLPDLDAIDEETWASAALVWVCYPNNPTGAVAPLSFYERLAELAREHDVLVCSDEAYTELWFEEPPSSALQIADRSNVVVFNTLSKRSSMTGYRCGFIAAPEDVIESLRKFRPNVGTAPQVFVQRAGVAAWGDEAHVERNRALYARKRQLFLDVFARRGVALAGSAATMYLWVEVPEGEASVSFAERLLEHGIVVAPGSYFGPSGEGYVRFALVPTEQECAEAAALLEEVL
ncbi:MAG TPA: aminotransferase class I/II-fold pyridoxal phosphate-dependent enzyme [Gaiellaceae bacterium]|nr:aminotransferase class I/II-fold pyridoxal phosphate-dependent enzyme [Gaiellaceae bacterium]